MSGKRKFPNSNARMREFIQKFKLKKMKLNQLNENESSITSQSESITLDLSTLNEKTPNDKIQKVIDVDSLKARVAYLNCSTQKGRNEVVRSSNEENIKKKLVLESIDKTKGHQETATVATKPVKSAGLSSKIATEIRDHFGKLSKQVSNIISEQTEINNKLDKITILLTDIRQQQLLDKATMYSTLSYHKMKLQEELKNLKYTLNNQYDESDFIAQTQLTFNEYLMLKKSQSFINDEGETNSNNGISKEAKNLIEVTEKKSKSKPAVNIAPSIQNKDIDMDTLKVSKSLIATRESAENDSTSKALIATREPTQNDSTSKVQDITEAIISEGNKRGVDTVALRRGTRLRVKPSRVLEATGKFSNDESGLLASDKKQTVLNKGLKLKASINNKVIISNVAEIVQDNSNTSDVRTKQSHRGTSRRGTSRRGRSRRGTVALSTSAKVESSKFENITTTPPSKSFLTSDNHRFDEDLDDDTLRFCEQQLVKTHPEYFK